MKPNFQYTPCSKVPVVSGYGETAVHTWNSCNRKLTNKIPSQSIHILTETTYPRTLRFYFYGCLSRSAIEGHSTVFSGKKPLIIMVILLVHDGSMFNAKAERDRREQASNKCRHHHVKCLLVCAFPVAVVTVGVFLVSVGLWSASFSTRSVLMTAGVAVYITGVVVFVIINLRDRSCKQGCDSDDFGEEISGEFFTSESRQSFPTVAMDSTSGPKLCILETAL